MAGSVFDTETEKGDGFDCGNSTAKWKSVRWGSSNGARGHGEIEKTKSWDSVRARWCALAKVQPCSAGLCCYSLCLGRGFGVPTLGWSWGSLRGWGWGRALASEWWVSEQCVRFLSPWTLLGALLLGNGAARCGATVLIGQSHRERGLDGCVTFGYHLSIESSPLSRLVTSLFFSFSFFLFLKSGCGYRYRYRYDMILIRCYG